jgi:glycine oxidase
MPLNKLNSNESFILVKGAGMVGRLIAYNLIKQKIPVILRDIDDLLKPKNCSSVAGGMMAPYCEMENASREVFELGFQSLQLWDEVVQELSCLTFKTSPNLFYHRKGIILLAHGRDRGALYHHVEKLKRDGLWSDEKMKILDGTAISLLEPDLIERMDRPLVGVHFLEEGQIDPRTTLEALGNYFLKFSQENPELLKLEFNYQENKKECLKYKTIINCTGLAGKEQIPNLRGVRGEMITVHAPMVNLTRPIRLLHPRQSMYIIPRPDQRYLIGATMVESENKNAITVRSTLELLSAAYSLHSGFAEASVIESNVHLRPALPDHNPIIDFSLNQWNINGLFRHGIMMAPMVAKLTVDKIAQRDSHSTL